MSIERVAWVFPGQGVPAEVMLSYLTAVSTLREAQEPYEKLCAALGEDAIDLGRHDVSQLTANRTSSLVMTFLSIALMRHANNMALPSAPCAMAGYSVGQWAALHAAGSLDAETLLDVVGTRAERMDEAIKGQQTGMLGIVGVSESAVERICLANRENGGHAIVSNYNSVGNLTVAGTLDDILDVQTSVAKLNPKVLERLPVAGAWHSPFLSQAARAFRDDLSSLEWVPAQPGVIDNTTGGWLPSDSDSVREQLAQHVCQPVRWYHGLRTMIDAGANLIVEIGAGNMLSSFGMFYDRSVRHVPLSRLSRPLADALRSL